MIRLSEGEPFAGSVLLDADIVLLQRVCSRAGDATTSGFQVGELLDQIALASRGGFRVGLTAAEANALASRIFDDCLSARGKSVELETLRLGSALDTYGEIDWCALEAPRATTGGGDAPRRRPDEVTQLATATASTPQATQGSTSPGRAAGATEVLRQSVGEPAGPSALLAAARTRERNKHLAIAAAVAVTIAAVIVLSTGRTSKSSSVTAASKSATVVPIPSSAPLASSPNLADETSTSVLSSSSSPSEAVPSSSALGTVAERFVSELEATGAVSELKRMIESSGEPWGDTLMTFGTNICRDLNRGYTEQREQQRIVRVIEDVNGDRGPTAPGIAGTRAVGDLVAVAHRTLCPSAAPVTTSPTTRSTTSARPSTSAPPVRPVIGRIENPCGQAVCKVYLRTSPRPDLSRPSDRYYLDGDDVPLSCETEGTEVRDGDSGAASTRWYRTEDGLYLSALYVRATPKLGQC